MPESVLYSPGEIMWGGLLSEITEKNPLLMITLVNEGIIQTSLEILESKTNKQKKKVKTFQPQTCVIRIQLEVGMPSF